MRKIASLLLVLLLGSSALLAHGGGSVSDLVEKGKGRHHPVSSTKDAPVEVGCRRMTHEEGYQG
jgi:hypothetical protein